MSRLPLPTAWQRVNRRGLCCYTLSGERHDTFVLAYAEHDGSTGEAFAWLPIAADGSVSTDDLDRALAPEPDIGSPVPSVAALDRRARRERSAELDARCRERFGLGIGESRVSNPNFLSEEWARHEAGMSGSAA